MSFDRRLTLATPQVAALALEGVLAAERYVEPVPMQVVAQTSGIYSGPHAPLDDQLLFGERFDVLIDDGRFVFGQARRDGYVGWVEADTLGPVLTAPTHWVSALGTFVFQQASLKTHAEMRLSLNSLVAVEAEEGRYRKLAGAGWVVAEHLSPIGTVLTDPAGVCERFLGAPYLWGGRGSEGLDCSGLVQQGFYACGLACPRDTDMQAGMGEAVVASELRRNDLVFWKGHVGIMLDGVRLLHANGHHMMTVIEPLAQALARIEAAGAGAPTGYRRVL